VNRADPSGMQPPRGPGCEYACIIYKYAACPVFQRHAFSDCWYRYGPDYITCVVCCECVLCYCLCNCYNSIEAYCADTCKLLAWTCIAACGSREGPKPMSQPYAIE